MYLSEIYFTKYILSIVMIILLYSYVYYAKMTILVLKCPFKDKVVYCSTTVMNPKYFWELEFITVAPQY